MNRDDTLWKGILENLCEDFLRFFFEDAGKLLNIQKGFEFLDKELEQLFPSEEIDTPKFVDKLVKVFTTAGKEEWVLVHIEVQGYRDKDFGKRMFTYFYRILDKYGKKLPLSPFSPTGIKNIVPRYLNMSSLEPEMSFPLTLIKLLTSTK